MLGEHIHSYFVRNKRAEWADYSAYVTDWERARYLSLL
ncbi:MAG: glutamine synthetase [Coriobacteriales bacterium]|nr:glutamine synthetase [Coriobacteriales bacterium]